MELKRQFIINENNQKVVVQLDIATFEKIENILENFALVQLINEDDSDVLILDSAKKFYATLDMACYRFP